MSYTEMYLPGFAPSAPPPVFDPRAYIPIPTPQPPPQVSTTQPQFDPRAYIPVPSQPQGEPQTFGRPFDPNAYIPKPSQAQPQKGNQNPFRNQTVTSTSNSNQTDERCDWSVKFGSGDQGGTAFHAEIVKNVNDGESSGKDDSLGYSGSSDDESNLNERTDSEADNLPNDANKKSDLIKKADATSEEMEKILNEDGSFSSQTAFMANVSASTSQVPGIDLIKMYAPAARLKFTIDKMNVQCTFLRGVIEENVFVEQINRVCGCLGMD
ncbi:hypothetical protein HanHA89_Chr09g0321481 [Helianthus annuus]|nr:hypothetical protein HanHA89_Chr09g0321481 [Helianthus annuus]